MTKESLNTFFYPFSNFSQGVFSAFTNSLLPLYLALFTQNTALIGILVTASLFENAIAPLFIGPLSDRIESPLGRRKIFILIGWILTVLILLFIPFAKSLTWLIVLILVMGFCKSLTSAPILAMLPGNSTLDSRSKVAAFLSIAALVGQVALTAFGSSRFCLRCRLFHCFSLATIKTKSKGKYPGNYIAIYGSFSRIVLATDICCPRS